METQTEQNVGNGQAAELQRREQERRVAEAARHVLGQLANVEAPTGLLARAADALEAIGAELDALEPLPITSVDDIRDLNRHRRTAFTGPHSILTPPMSFELSDGKVHGHVYFNRAFEGPPGRVHGGFIAAAFDVALARAQSLTGRMGMTIELTVRYLAGTPLFEDLDFVCQLDRIEGRRVYTSGKLMAGDQVCAEGEAVFKAGRRRPHQTPLGAPPPTRH